MAAVEEIRIALPPEMVAMVRQAVEAGAYASSSEVVRDALLVWSAKRALRECGAEDLRQLWQEAIEDSSPRMASEEILNRLERKYQARVDSADAGVDAG
jgi:antitoxin ParD1/3/4